MAKPPTIASLVRIATHSEEDYVANTTAIFAEQDSDRIMEYFGRLSLPRTWAEEKPGAFGDEAIQSARSIDFEHAEMAGVTKYLERNQRKVKWHISHPGTDGVESVMLIFAAQADFAKLRMQRILWLLGQQEVLSPEEWGKTRELLNRGFRDYRNILQLVTGRWMEAVSEAAESPEAFITAMQPFPKLIREKTVMLEEMRDEIEKVRVELAVQPDGYPVVKPPRYFGGDLLDNASWNHFWGQVSTLGDGMRAQIGLTV
ncbi:MAG: hypothetical protein VX899_08330 [Myxococcota bacterium]|nr:hypothetical protein [Myxococcota bacterium]